MVHVCLGEEGRYVAGTENPISDCLARALVKGGYERTVQCGGQYLIVQVLRYVRRGAGQGNRYAYIG